MKIVVSNVKRSKKIRKRNFRIAFFSSIFILCTSSYFLNKNNISLKDFKINVSISDFILDGLSNLNSKDKNNVEKVNYFDISRLFLANVTSKDNSNSSLHIVYRKDDYSKFYYDYNNEEFKAWYDLHARDAEKHYYACGDFEHIYEGDLSPLSDYLTDDEKSKDKFSIDELKDIEKRIISNQLGNSYSYKQIN